METLEVKGKALIGLLAPAIVGIVTIGATADALGIVSCVLGLAAAMVMYFLLGGK